MADAPWDQVERRHEPGDGGRRVVDHGINPACIQRTADALAEGHQLATALELKIQEMRRERESQLAEINKAIALQTQNITRLTEFQHEQAQELKEFRALAARFSTSLDLLLDEYGDRKKEKTEGTKTWRTFFMGLLEKAAWVAVGVVGLALIEFIKSYLSKGG